MQVLPVECVLQESDDVSANGILRGETLGPCQDFPLIQGGLLDWETEGKTER